MRLAVVLLLLLVVPAEAAAWRAPVGGPVTRGFDLGANPFEGGRHRGADFAAPAGAVVRAPCGGRVVVAGRVGTSGGVVTLLCGRWRVSVLPLATIVVRRGVVARAGDRVGTLAPSREHAGVHLGVRRDGRRFGYVDPLRFLEPTHPAPPLLVGRRGPRAPARRPAPAPRPSAPPAPAPRPAPGLAPWPAWVGLALVLGGVPWQVRRVRARRGYRRTSTAAG